tara:strand:+ start:595 stop:975 length:381 start_codon:yes stop_codon:yes gene_type:complete
MIKMDDGSTKPINELVVGDKVMTNRQSDMQDTRYGLNDAVHQDFVEGDDFLSPELRNVTNKLTKLRNLIGDENFKAIDGVRSRDKEADAHWEMINDWLNNALIKETYPSKETLLVANKLWKKYNGN